MSRIVVIGTSNSVMGQKGFIKSLSIEHDVINISSGRVPFYYHIKTIEANRNIIESADLLIIDHYTNDINYYVRKLGNKYIQECEYLYQLLSTLNTNIINLLFPIEDLAARTTFSYYEKIKQLTNKYDLSLIDLNEYDFKSHNYYNSVHLNHKTSYILGISLSKIINSFKDIQPNGGKLLSTPFTIIDAKYLAKLNCQNKLKTFKNRLVEVDYIDIKSPIVTHDLSGMILKSIGYLVPKDIDNQSGICLNNQYCFSLTAGGYFHEVLEAEIKIEHELALSPLKGNYLDVNSMMSRGAISGNFNFLYITEILLSSGLPMNYQPAKRNSQPIFLKDLESMLDSIFIDEEIPTTKLSTIIINALRDAAIILEDIDLQKSYELMEIVHQQRPSAPFIKNKLAEYQKRLTQ